MVAVKSGQWWPKQQAGVRIRFSDLAESASWSVKSSMRLREKVQRPVGMLSCWLEVCVPNVRGVNGWGQKQTRTMFWYMRWPHTRVTEADGPQLDIIQGRGWAKGPRLCFRGPLSHHSQLFLSICTPVSPFPYPLYPLYPSFLFLPGGQEREDR